MLATASILSTPLEAGWQVEVTNSAFSSLQNVCTGTSPDCEITAGTSTTGGNSSVHLKGVSIFAKQSGGNSLANDSNKANLTIGEGVTITNSNNKQHSIIVRENTPFVGTIHNMGTLTTRGDTSNGSAVLIVWGSGAKVDSIINGTTGVISGGHTKSVGIGVKDKAVEVSTIINNGTIKAHKYGVQVELVENMKVGTIINTGTIEAINEYDGKTQGKQDPKIAGLLVERRDNKGENNKVSIDNKGLIKGGVWGVLLSGNFGTVKNTGTISGGYAGVNFVQGSKTKVDKLDLGGVIEGKEFGLLLNMDASTEVKEIEVKGQVKGAYTGIYVNNALKVDSLKIAEGGSVSGGEIGISNLGTTQSITIESGASVEGALGGITNSGTTGAIEVKGEVKTQGKNAIQNSGTINKGITIANGAELKGKIENKKGATIAGGITNDSNNKIVLKSEGNIGKNEQGATITNNGNGGVEVEAFVITGDSSGTPQKLVINGKGDSSKNKVENITVDTTVKLEKIQEEGLNSLVAGVPKDNVANISHIDSEIKINKTGNIEFKANANKVGRTVTKALSASADKRANFAETTMNNSLKGLSHSLKQQMRATIGSNSLDRDAMYASAGLNDFTTSFDLPNPRTSAAFMLPYYTKHSSQMQEGWNDATGDTKGIVVGYTRLIGEDFLGVYAGSDKMKLDASNPKDNNAMALENNTYYGGIKYAGIFQKIEEHELYYRVDGKLAWTQNKITETIGGEQATGRPSTIGYGLGINVGANLSLSPTTTLVPEMGFAYEGGIMDAYTIKINRHTKTYESEPTHFYNTTLSLGWIENWNAFIQTQLEGGGRYNFNRKARTTLKVEGVGATTTKLNARETFSPFIGSSVIFTFQPNLVLSLNYLGVFDNQTKNNTFYSQFAYLW